MYTQSQLQGTPCRLDCFSSQFLSLTNNCGEWLLSRRCFRCCSIDILVTHLHSCRGWVLLLPHTVRLAGHFHECFGYPFRSFQDSSKVFFISTEKQFLLSSHGVVWEKCLFVVDADHHSCSERVYVSIGMHGTLPSTACSKVKVMVWYRLLKWQNLLICCNNHFSIQLYMYIVWHSQLCVKLHLYTYTLALYISWCTLHRFRSKSESQKSSFTTPQPSCP